MSAIYFSSWGDEIVDNRDKALQDFAPVKNISLPEYFREHEEINALIGWNGLVLRSSEVNIIDLCREHMEAVQKASCGKCFPCRTGTKIMSDLLTTLCEGQGTFEDLEDLENLAKTISLSSKCGIGQTGPLPILDAIKYFKKEFDQVIEKSKKVFSSTIYKSKLTAPCMDACPFHLDIPAYVESIKDGDFKKSLEIIKDRLPIPGVLGRVCVRPCEENCRRMILDDPISIKHLKRFVADHAILRKDKPVLRQNPSSKTGRVAIVGSGPAGITCAYHLAIMGHQVIIYERLGEPGGMAAVGIPDYRLPRDIIKSEYDQIKKLGVEIKYNTNVGTDISLKQLEDENNAVLIAIGAHLGTSMRVEGENENYQGFIPGVKYLLDINSGKDPYPEGKKVVVIGGGNVAIDCVRSSFRINKPDVNLVYRRTKNEMPADHVEITDAEEEKVVFHYLTNPTKVIAENGKVVGLECIKMELGEPDESGRRRPVPVEGSEFIIKCDIVVPAIGQTIDLSLLESMDDISTTRWSTIDVNEFTKQSNQPKVFSVGDCETGPGALITACASGCKAADNIDKMINDIKLKPVEDDHFDKLLSTVKVFDPNEKIGLLGGRKGHGLEMLPPETRKTTFDEVENGFSTKDAMDEADRCLRCYRVTTVAI
jgi:formate dehydrogenase beta subunit